MTTGTSYELPWHVVSSIGKFVSGHDTEKAATADALERNGRAIVLDIEFGYKAISKGGNDDN